MNVTKKYTILTLSIAGAPVETIVAELGVNDHAGGHRSWSATARAKGPLKAWGDDPVEVTITTAGKTLTGGAFIDPTYFSAGPDLETELRLVGTGDFHFV